MIQEILIIHVTDMHLFVDKNGNERPRADCALIVRAAELAAQKIAPALLSDLVSGLQRHSPRALAALWRTIKEILGASRPPIVVFAQTGDVEAYGGRPTPNGFEFPGYDYIDAEVSRRFGKSLHHVSHVYGNHDVWPGTFPLAAFPPKNCAAAATDLRKHKLFAGPMPLVERFDINHIGFEFYSINSVTFERRANAWARGDLHPNDPHLHGRFARTSTTSLAKELLAIAPSPIHEKATIRFVLMHHPPHFFAATGQKTDRLEGPIDDVSPLMEALGRLRIHFIMCGHRHKLDPAAGVTLQVRPRGPGAPQPPLPQTTVQLAAGTPTQKNAEYMFSTYLVRVDAANNLVELDRTIYTYDGLSQVFDPEPREALVREMRVAP